MARPKITIPREDASTPRAKFDSRELVVRKLTLSGIGAECVGTDEAGNEYQALVFLGPRMAEEMETSLDLLGKESFRRVEGLAAINLCQVAHHNPTLLDARPHAITH